LDARRSLARSLACRRNFAEPRPEIGVETTPAGAASQYQRCSSPRGGAMTGDGSVIYRRRRRQTD